MKQKKQFRELSDDELQQVTGGKEQFPEFPDDPCKNPTYKDNHLDECVIVFGTTTEDNK